MQPVNIMPVMDSGTTELETMQLPIEDLTRLDNFF